MRRLVEAELLLELLDEFRVEPLRAAIFRGPAASPGCRLGLASPAPAMSPPPPANFEVAPSVVALQLRDDALDRTAGRELHDDEGDQHDAEHVGIISSMRRAI